MVVSGGRRKSLPPSQSSHPSVSVASTLATFSEIFVEAGRRFPVWCGGRCQLGCRLGFVSLHNCWRKHHRVSRWAVLCLHRSGTMKLGQCSPTSVAHFSLLWPKSFPSHSQPTKSRGIAAMDPQGNPGSHFVQLLLHLLPLLSCAAPLFFLPTGPSLLLVALCPSSR
jgi:hypothetical protein